MADCTTSWLQRQSPELANRFRVLKVIGEGAAGAVYKVIDLQRGNRLVALKVLTDKSAFDENTIARFLQEWRTCQSLSHPNIVQAYDLIELPETVAFSMEYVEGQDLAELISARRPAEDELDAIFDQVLTALEMLHRNGILHRDIKLENILVGVDGRVKVADLGLMKAQHGGGMTRTGVLLGTVQYFPPEYLRRSCYDSRGDLYATGLAMFEVLSGERRLHEIPDKKIVEHLLHTKFAMPWEKLKGVSERHRRFLRRALEPDPNRRFQSAAEMRSALKDRRPPLMPCDAPPAREPERCGLWGKALAAAACAALFAAAGFAALW